MKSWRMRLTLLAVGAIAAGCNSGGGNHDIPPPPEFINGQFVFSEADAPAPLEEAETEKAFDWSQRMEFEPPNKTRTNPFVAGVDGENGNQAAAESDSEPEDAVRIKGFVNVHKLRVFVRVGDDFRPLAEGESLNNVTVLKIQPPHVTIQREGETEVRSLLDEPIEQHQATRDEFGDDDPEEDWAAPVDRPQPL